MNTVVLSWRYLWSRPLAAALNLLLMTLGLTSMTFVLLASHQLDRAFERDLYRATALVLKTDAEPKDRYLQLASDPDLFNRWESGQRLATNRLLAAVRGESEAVLDPAFVGAMRGVLQHPQLDAAFKALVLDLLPPTSR